MQVVGGVYGSGGGGYAAPRDDSNDGSSVDLEDEECHVLEEAFNTPLQHQPAPVVTNPLTSPRQHQQHSNLPGRRGVGASAPPVAPGRPPVPPFPHIHINNNNAAAPLQQNTVVMEELDNDNDTPMMRVEMALRRMAVLPKLSDALYNPTNQKRSAAERYADANKAVSDIRRCSPWRRHNNTNDAGNKNNAAEDQSVGGFLDESGDLHYHLEAAGVSPHHQQSTLELELLGMYKKGGTSSFVDQSSLPYAGGGNGASFQSNVGGGGGSIITFAHNSVFSETPKSRATPRRRMMSEAGENVLRRPSPHRHNQSVSQLSQQRINSMTGGGRRNSINNNITSSSQFQQDQGAADEMSHPGGMSRSGSVCSSAASFATVRSTAGATPSSYLRDIHDGDNHHTHRDDETHRGVTSPSQHHMSGLATPMTSHHSIGGKAVVPVYDTVATQLHISIRITAPQLLLHPILFPQLEEATVTLSPYDLGYAFETDPNPFSLRDLLALPTSTLTRGLCAAVLDTLVYPAMQRWLGNQHGCNNTQHHTISPEELLEVGLEGCEDSSLATCSTRAVRDVLGPAMHLLQSLRYGSEEDVLAAWPTEAAFKEAKVPNPTNITKNKDTNNSSSNSRRGVDGGENGDDSGSSSTSDEEDEEYRRGGGSASTNHPKFIYLSSPESALGSYRELHAWGRQLTARHLVEGATQFRDVRRTRLPNGNLLEPTNTPKSTKEVPLDIFLLCRSRNDSRQ